MAGGLVWMPPEARILPVAFHVDEYVVMVMVMFCLGDIVSIWLGDRSADDLVLMHSSWLYIIPFFSTVDNIGAVMIVWTVLRRYVYQFILVWKYEVRAT